MLIHLSRMVSRPGGIISDDFRSAKSEEVKFLLSQK